MYNIKSKNTSKIIAFTLLFLVGLGFSNTAKAQSATDVLRYSLQYPSYDPVTMVMPGVATATGFGAFQENPAVMALFDKSFFTAGLSDRYVSETGDFLGNDATFDINSLGISHAGFLYKFPAARGSLVFGGGYSLSTGYNRALSGFGYNEQTTLTDSYVLTPDDVLFFAAFDAFAIDYATAAQSYDETASIFRVDSPYQGIEQTFEITEEGTSGEYSAFIATELLKGLMVGASIGTITGNYSYKRDFIETDSKQMYETQFTDDQGNIIGIDNILSVDTIDATFTGFSARIGVLYQITPHFNVGAGYQFPSIIFIDEEFNTTITNMLDDGYIYEEEAPGNISYKVKRPGRLYVGVAATDISGLTFSASVEKVDYTNARIKFDDIEFTDLENSINDNVQANLSDVYNVRLGMEYTISDMLTPRVGYGFYPSPEDNKNTDRHFYSAGFTSKITNNINLSGGVQYVTWNDETQLYSSTFGDEVVNESVNRWNIMAGFTYYFD